MKSRMMKIKNLSIVLMMVLSFSLYAVFANDSVLNDAYNNHQSDVQVQGAGNVIKLLSEDNKGSRHQRFILRLDSGQTILVAHNIDLAPKIANLRVNDLIEFYGEYEWNSRGGVIHWTHHDPSNRHAHGWLRHNGTTYQ